MLRIQKSLEGLEYGTVVITVHDSNIVQIDRTEKHRFSLKKSRPSPDRANHNQKSV
ncbi:MAG: YezD family protein [Thermoactinomyces vulgaris]